MTLQEHYNAIKNGKGNKAQFLKQAKYLFPQYVNQYSDFTTATNVLKSKQIISEAVGGVVSKGFNIWDWKKILAEEAKAEEKKVSKEVEDYNKSNFDNKDMKNADNINFNEIMKGFYCELKDEKNAGKTGDELKDMVVKNLAKDPLYYTKNGEFGVKDLGYTDDAPGLSNKTQPKTKEATILGGNDEVNSESDIVKDSLVGSTKKNVQDSLGDKEAKTSMPKKVKEMSVAPQNASGVKKMAMPGKEKKIRLKENLNLSQYDNMSDEELIQWAKEDGMEDFINYDEVGGLTNRRELLSVLLGKELEYDNEHGDFDYDTRDKEIDMWGPDDIDPAGGHGPSSHMEEAYQMPSVGQLSGGGGKRFIPKQIAFPSQIRKKFGDHILFNSANNQLYISQILFNNLIKGGSNQPDLKRMIMDIPPMVKQILNKSENYGPTVNFPNKEYKVYMPLNAVVEKATEDQFNKAGNKQYWAKDDLLIPNLNIQEGSINENYDEFLDAALNIILKYTKDPDDAEKELKAFDSRGFEGLSDVLKANLSRDEEWQDLMNPGTDPSSGLSSHLEESKLRSIIKSIIREELK